MYSCSASIWSQLQENDDDTSHVGDPTSQSSSSETMQRKELEPEAVTMSHACESELSSIDAHHSEPLSGEHCHDVDSTDASENGSTNQAPRSQSSTRLDSVVAAVTTSMSKQSSDESNTDELSPATRSADSDRTQWTSARVVEIRVPSSPVSTNSRKSAAKSHSIVLNPLHAAKEIWLSFVRRAYRKFGKDLLSDMDLRWRTRFHACSGVETNRCCS